MEASEWFKPAVIVAAIAAVAAIIGAWNAWRARRGHERKPFLLIACRVRPWAKSPPGWYVVDIAVSNPTPSQWLLESLSVWKPRSAGIAMAESGTKEDHDDYVLKRFVELDMVLDIRRSSTTLFRETSRRDDQHVQVVLFLPPSRVPLFSKRRRSLLMSLTVSSLEADERRTTIDIYRTLAAQTNNQNA